MVAQLAADRYSYTSCMPFAVLFSVVIYKIMIQKKYRKFVSFSCLLIFTILGILTYRQTQTWKNTLSLWKQVAKIADNSDSRVFLIRYYIKNNQAQKALEILEKSKQKEDIERTSLLFTQAHYQLKNYKKAKHYLKIAKKAKQNLEQKFLIYLWYAHIYMKEKKFKEAELFFQKAFDLEIKRISARFSNGNIELRYIRVGTYSVHGKITKAVACIYLGKLYQLKGEYQKAEAIWKKGIQFFPKFVGFYISLAFLYERQGENSKFFKYIRKALDIYLEDVKNGGYDFQGIINIIQCGLKAKQPGRVLPLALETVDIYPENSIAHFYLANIYMVEGKLKKAIKSFEKAIQINPKITGAYHSLIQIYQYLGKKSLVEKYQNLLLQKKE